MEQNTCDFIKAETNTAKGGESITEIRIVDSLMGSGKTTWAIRHMNENPDRPYIFITPYLSEGVRIQEACPGLDFISPEEQPTKQAHFHKLLHDGRNIVISHELFKLLELSGPEVELVQRYGYTLMLDEVLEVLDLVDISADDLHDLIGQERIIVSSEGKVSWNGKYFGEFNPLMRQVKRKSIQMCETGELVWMFPIELLMAFAEVYILTFMFEGSIMEQYLKIHGLTGEYYYIEDGRLQAGKQDLRSEKQRLRELIDIYEGALNDIGANPHKLRMVRGRKPREMPFSRGWTDKGLKNGNIKQAKRNAYNYLHNHQHTSSDDAMWSMLMEKRPGSKPSLNGRYVQSFCPCNCRACNNYRERSSLVYMVDVYCNPAIVNWLEKHGGNIDRDAYALSQLLQWMWRSRLRDGDSIGIYLPSQRMRDLLQAWLAV